MIEVLINNVSCFVNCFNCYMNYCIVILTFNKLQELYAFISQSLEASSTVTKHDGIFSFFLFKRTFMKMMKKQNLISNQLSSNKYLENRSIKALSVIWYVTLLQRRRSNNLHFCTRDAPETEKQTLSKIGIARFKLFNQKFDANV